MKKGELTVSQTKPHPSSCQTRPEAPPASNHRAEAAVLASLLENCPAELPPNLARLIRAAPESFAGAFAPVASAVKTLRAEGTGVNLVTVRQALPEAHQGKALQLADPGLALPMDLAELEAETLWREYSKRQARRLLLEGADHLEAGSATVETISRIVGSGLAGLGATDSAPESLPPVQDSALLVAQPPEPPAEIVSGLLHRGSKLVIGGSSKSNKTWVLGDLGLSVAYGGYWLGFRCQKHKVLFLNLEVQEWAFAQRLQALCRAKCITPEPGRLDVWNLRGYSAPFDVILPRVTERIRADGYGLLVLDPMYKLIGNLDENKAGDIARIMNGIERLAVDTGAAVAFSAHFSKGNQAAKESIDRISGSGVFARDPDSILVLTRHQQDQAFVVEATLRNHKPVEPFAVRWDYPLMRRDDDLDPTAIKQPAKGGRGRKYVPEMLLEMLGPRKLKTSAWQERCLSESGIPKTNFYELRAVLERDGLIAKDEKDRWFKSRSPETPETQLPNHPKSVGPETL